VRRHGTYVNRQKEIQRVAAVRCSVLQCVAVLHTRRRDATVGNSQRVAVKRCRLL